MKSEKHFSINYFPNHVYFISSSLLYNITVNDYQTLNLKVRIALHGNNDCMRKKISPWLLYGLAYCDLQIAAACLLKSMDAV